MGNYWLDLIDPNDLIGLKFLDGTIINAYSTPDGQICIQMRGITGGIAVISPKVARKIINGEQ